MTDFSQDKFSKLPQLALLYLEMGCVPIGNIIKARRLKYLPHLATRDEGEMLSKVLLTQWKYPDGKGEWTEQVKNYLKEFGLG